MTGVFQANYPGELRAAAGRHTVSGVLPRLRSLAEAIDERLRSRWPDTVIPEYPALARPGARLARLRRDKAGD